MCVCLRLLVDWYCGFSAVAAWYGHVMLDWREPGAHWEGLRAAIMQQDLISCSLDLSLFSSLLLPSSSSPKLSLLLSTFVFASLLYFWFASSSECTPMWPVKINTIDQTKLPNCWQVSLFFSLLRSCEVDECCPLVVKTRHIQTLLYSNPSFFYLKVKLVMLVLRVVAHMSLHVF